MRKPPPRPKSAKQQQQVWANLAAGTGSTITAWSTGTGSTTFVSSTITNSPTMPISQQQAQALISVHQMQAQLAATMPVGNLAAPGAPGGSPARLQGDHWELPDGAKIVFDDLGGYEFLDADAKVRHKGNPLLEFNKYINASDQLEAFIDYVAKLGKIGKGEFLNLPIELFIRWLIIKAAEADGDVLPPEQQVLALPGQPRCKCGRFLSRVKARQGLLFCNAGHFERYERLAA